MIDTLHVDYPHSYGTHIPLLAATLARLSELGNSPVVEFGCGHYSTSLISAFTRLSGRGHIIVETDREWLYKTVSPSVLSHARVRVVGHSYEAIPLLPDGMSLAFVDCEATNFARARVLSDLQGRADVVVIHDTEPTNEKLYSLSPQMAEYRYRYTDTSRVPHTTILSNTYPVDQWFEAVFTMIPATETSVREQG